MFLKYRLKIRNWIKNNKNKIILVLIIWAIIFVINLILKNRKVEVTLNTTYTPHELVLSDTGETVPEKLREPIEKLIDDFVNYCNKKDYTNAYSLLSNDCKKNVFNNQEDEFKEYVDEVFPTEKIYSLQSYSKKDDLYIYNIKILDNILASGLTHQEFFYYEEKYGISQEDDELKLTIGNYMGKEKIKRFAEDDNVKIRITEKIMFYSKEVYTIKITNKTEHTMVIVDGNEEEEILMSIGNATRNIEDSNLFVIIEPGQTKEFQIRFSKFYDETSEPESMIFNKIRILDNYTGNKETYEQEIENAVKKYSLGIKLD